MIDYKARIEELKKTHKNKSDVEYPFTPGEVLEILESKPAGDTVSDCFFCPMDNVYDGAIMHSYSAWWCSKDQSEVRTHIGFIVGGPVPLWVSDTERMVDNSGKKWDKITNAELIRFIKKVMKSARAFETVSAV